MTHPLTPREKPLGQIAYDGWAQGLPGCEWDNQTETQKRAWSKAADAILTALASGSGDHAELATLAEAAKAAGDPFYSFEGIAEWGEFQAAANPATVLAILAENATLRAANDVLEVERIGLRSAIFGRHEYDPALRHGNFIEMARATEDARKGAVARATEAERKLAEAVGLLRGVDGGAATEDWWRVKVRNFITKEAERG